jgi:hypothetical protein
MILALIGVSVPYARVKPFAVGVQGRDRLAQRLGPLDALEARW